MNATKLIKSTLLSLLFLTLWLPQWASAVQIQVSLDRAPVNIDESFQIIFAASDTPDGAPDFSPLEQEFTILNQSQSSNTTIVNGNLNKTIQWTLNVMAKKQGRLTIPVIKFGDDSSQPLPVVVNKNNESKEKTNDSELFLEVKATPESTYVQSQIIYTLRLYRRVDITQAKLTEPELPDAVIEKLGEDADYNALHNGINYRVTERKYVIFPQKSGQLVINPLELTADVIGGNGNPNFPDFFNPQATQTKRIVSKKIVLNVKPAPANFTGQHWLTAEQLELKQEWSGDTQQVKVGEPLTRTLTLQAKSATVGQLPELNTVKSDDQLKVYPDQPVLQEQKQTDGLMSSRQEKIAFIPSKARTYTLPAIEIPWFNSQSQKIETATLPSVTLTAVGTPGTATPTTVPPPTATTITSSDKPASKATAKAKPKPKKPLLKSQPSYNKWLWAGCVFFAAGWLITLIYFLARRSDKKQGNTQNEADVDVKAAIKKLKQACTDNNTTAAKEALLEWGHLQFGATSLGAVATFCEARLRDEILQLNQILYGKEAETWDGKKLFQTFIENKARTAIANKDSSLEPLYRL